MTDGKRYVPTVQLDERKLKLCEGIVRGVPKTEIARELGVNRATLYTWLEEPEVAEYLLSMAEDRRDAMEQQLVAVASASADALLTAIARGKALTVAADPTAPGLSEFAAVFDRVIRAVQLAQGKPTAIRREEHTDTGARVERLLKLERELESRTVETTATEELEDE